MARAPKKGALVPLADQNREEMRVRALEAAGMSPETLARVVKVLDSALDANDRFGSANWDARIRAADLLTYLAGVQPSRASGSGGSGRTVVEVHIAGFAKAPKTIDVTPS